MMSEGRRFPEPCRRRRARKARSTQMGQNGTRAKCDTPWDMTKWDQRWACGA